MQIQGQLNISGKDICFFIAYVNDRQPIFVEAILRDEVFWHEIMLPKLQGFYLNCVLPEIVHRRAEKGQKCLDPPK